MDAPLGTPVVHTAGSPEFPLLFVDAGSLCAVFAPTRGGRLLSLSIAGEELLWQNPSLLDAKFLPRAAISEWPNGEGGMGTWANLGGSKTWPAPQGWDGPDMWAGPPDTVLDSGVWTLHVTESAGVVNVRLVSADDAQSGLCMTREFTFTASTFEFTEAITFENISNRTVRWAPWEVCQVRTSPGGFVTFDEASEAQMRDLGLYEGTAVRTADAEHVSYETGFGVSKHGCVGGTGAIRYRRPSGTTLTLSLLPVAGAEYPDGGCRTEVWLQRPTASSIDELGGLHPDAHLAELEVLGPLVTLEPNESNTVIITWSVSRDGR